MTQATGHIQRLLLIILTSTTILIGSGCNSNDIYTKYMQPELLYLKNQPYSSLYVEVDSVEGVEVPDEWLDALEKYLATYCSKSDGIKIVCDEPIPFNEIKDMPIGPASIFCIDGPDLNLSPQPAYLHIFFYDLDKISIKSTDYPFVRFDCPTTIFYNVDYAKNRNKQFAPFALSHEAGHVLGLCHNKSHGDGSHCKNYNCLMNSTVGILEEIGLIFGIPTKKKLCNDCKTDITNYKSEGVDPNLTFDGPFLVRKEDGYSVATLPVCVLIIPEAFEKGFNWQKVLDRIKKHSLEKKFKYFYKNILTLKNEDGSPIDISLYRDIFGKASYDPDPEVRHYASHMLETLEIKEQE